MTTRALHRLMAALTGGVGAYALVLNLFLISAFAPSSAAQTAFGDGYVLCVSAPDGAGHAPDGQGKAATLHCPICIGRADACGLPPAVAVLAERLAIVAALTTDTAVTERAFEAPHPSHARGPPPAA